MTSVLEAVWSSKLPAAVGSSDEDGAAGLNLRAHDDAVSTAFSKSQDDLKSIWLLTSRSMELSQRTMLTLTSLAILLGQNCAIRDEYFAIRFLLHTAILERSCLSSRRIQGTTSSESTEMDTHNFLLKFSTTANNVLLCGLWMKVVKGQQHRCNIADVVDGRLFNAVISESIDLNHFPPCIRQDFETLLDVLTSMLGHQLKTKNMCLQVSGGEPLPTAPARVSGIDLESVNLLGE